MSAGISSPHRIAVDYSYVYWADTGNDTIKRAQTFGSHTVTTIADSSDGVSNVAAIALDGSYLYWADTGNDSVREVATFSPYTVTTLVNTGLANPQDLEVGRNGSYLYVLDRNGAASTIKRVQTFGSHTVTTLASNTGDTPMDDPVSLTLDPDNDFVYWLDEDDRAVRRVAADGATGTFETLTTLAGAAVTDLTLSPDGGAVYWLDNSSNRVKRIATNGSGSVTDVVTSGLSVPLRMRVAQDTETVAGSCITDAGTLDADYATHDWEADIDATCPAAFYTFRLADAADLRITARSSSINPLPILRKGGIGGELVALTETSNGASTPYVYQAEAGQHAIELVREFNSANPAGGFSAKLQTQPMLSGCDVNLGTLSSDQLQVFGAHDPDCGDTRKYFFYLEFQASVSASASGVGFTPNIELRPGSASDSATPTAQNSGNPADFYQSATSGSYRINVENITAGDTYNLSLQAFGLPPPTRTPIPSPTPRLQTNVDVRIEPNPQGYAYELNHAPYAFVLEGNPDSFPGAGALHRRRRAHHRHLGGVAGLRRLHRGGAGRPGPRGVLPPPHLRPRRPRRHPAGRTRVRPRPAGHLLHPHRRRPGAHAGSRPGSGDDPSRRRGPAPAGRAHQGRVRRRQHRLQRGPAAQRTGRAGLRRAVPGAHRGEPGTDQRVFRRHRSGAVHHRPLPGPPDDRHAPVVRGRSGGGRHLPGAGAGLPQVPEGRIVTGPGTFDRASDREGSGRC